MVNVRGRNQSVMAIATPAKGGEQGSVSGNQGTTVPHMSALSDAELAKLSRDLVTEANAVPAGASNVPLLVQVTAALVESVRRRDAIAASRVEARAS